MRGKVLKILLIFLIFVLVSCQSTSEYNNSSNTSGKANTWISISYSDLVNKSILTHSGETIGDVIKQIPKYDDSIKGLVQSYLEPFSILGG